MHPKDTAEPPELLVGMQPAPTGIDYLALLEAEHRQATRRSINFADLPDQEPRRRLRLPLTQARAALDEWLAWASSPKLTPFAKLARTIRHYRTSIVATIE
ncbi:MAG: hypothetical protein EA388_12170 [Nitriliruptor sp.]|nr:MAG: hypothetical protein EA388_12170 [Nitriliruptor sp.]